MAEEIEESCTGRPDYSERAKHLPRKIMNKMLAEALGVMNDVEGRDAEYTYNSAMVVR